MWNIRFWGFQTRWKAMFQQQICMGAWEKLLEKSLRTIILDMELEDHGILFWSPCRRGYQFSTWKRKIWPDLIAEKIRCRTGHIYWQSKNAWLKWVLILMAVRISKSWKLGSEISSSKYKKGEGGSIPLKNISIEGTFWTVVCRPSL